MAGWYRADSARYAHRKVARLARRLGVHLMHACGIHDVLCALVTQAEHEDGSMLGIEAIDIAEACRWDGDEAELLEVLVEVGIVDRDADGSLWLHGYEERSGATVRERKNDRFRKAGRSGGASVAAPAALPTEAPSEPPPEVQRSSDGGSNARTNVRTYERTNERERASAPPAPVEELIADATRLTTRAAILATATEADVYREAWNEHRGPLPEAPAWGLGSLPLLRAALARDHARHDPRWWGELAQRAARARWLVQAKHGLVFFLHRKDGEARIEALFRGEYDAVRVPQTSEAREAAEAQARAARLRAETERISREASARASAPAPSREQISQALEAVDDPSTKKFLERVRGRAPPVATAT